MTNASDAANSAKKIVDIVDKIAKVLDKFHFLKREGQGICIKIPEKICQYDIVIRVQSSGFLTKNIDFPLPEVDRIIGTCLPSLTPLHQSLHKTPNGFTLTKEGIPNGTDLILLQFQYKIPDSKFILNLVETNVATEPLEYSDRDEYWMAVQLKFPQILQKAYSHLKLENVELNVDVAVDTEVKTAVPDYFIRSLRKIRELLSSQDRNIAHVRLLEYMQAKRRIGADIYALINQLSTIFIPDRFKDFLDITPPFRYFNSKFGTDFYDFPGQVLPRTMRVISRTDLSLETPATEGKVIYKKLDLLKELEKVFR
jgi:hypothetical protein